MRAKILSIGIAVTCLLLAVAGLHAADTERVLYSADGVNVTTPYGLSADASGNLYGAAGGTSTHPYGSIFRLAKGPTGHWNMSVLYEFRGGKDGDGPNGDLVFDSSGNLYGTTIYGGLSSGSGCCGTVFELTPTASGPWKEKPIYSFTDPSAGRYPYAGVIFDAVGNLYGTASVGGSTSDCGTVFELSPSSGGTWTETTLHQFQCGNDGALPAVPLVLDQKGNLYGTTWDGGGKNTTVCTYDGCGTVFELTPNSGTWTEKVLYAFGNGTDGGFPEGSLFIDRPGNLYGLAAGGGDLSACGGHGCGAVFELSPGSSGVWSESIAYAFLGGTDGQLPEGRLTVSWTGRLFGVTEGGGQACNCGTVFALSPTTGGGWQENVLYAFSGADDGAYPYDGLVLDKQGSLYGATYSGGTSNQGVVFKIIP